MNIIKTKDLTVGQELFTGNGIHGYSSIGIVTELTHHGKGIWTLRVNGNLFGNRIGSSAEWFVEA